MFLGLDFGTTGARACVLDSSGAILHSDRIAYGDAAQQSPEDWRIALHSLLRQLPPHIATALQGIAIDATSATVLLCDARLQPVGPALLYNNTCAQPQAETLQHIAPKDHVVCAASSGLAKFLWLTQHTAFEHAVYFMHQADWLSALLSGNGGISDYHNALKSGYDVEKLCWPDWVLRLPHSHLLPAVFTPGTVVGQVNPAIAQHFNINPECTIHAGTTDSIAAFIAADVHEPGSAVTSLGTTLVLKLLSTTRVECAQYGVYSHRYGDLWLAGGASNSGGGVLRQFFSDAQLQELSKRIDASVNSPLDYYPLRKPGERFPHNDPTMVPRITPRPTDDVAFLHGLLQGLSRIETEGYALLQRLGATPLNRVLSCGGGASNPSWLQMRGRLLGVPVAQAGNAEAAVGAAQLARRTGII